MCICKVPHKRGPSEFDPPGPRGDVARCKVASGDRMISTMVAVWKGPELSSQPEQSGPLYSQWNIGYSTESFYFLFFFSNGENVEVCYVFCLLLVMQQVTDVCTLQSGKLAKTSSNKVVVV